MGTVIYVGHKPVGHVDGDTFYKNVKGSQHFLFRPPAISFDVSTIKDAEDAGANTVCIYDSETDTYYYVDISIIWQHGFTIDRGHGEQIALINKWWRLSAEPNPEQLELFKESME